MSIPFKPDHITLKLLSRAKLFLEHAISHASGQSSIDRMIAIHGLDNAIEYMLRIISRHLSFETKSNKKLPEDLPGIAGTLNSFLKKEFNYHLSYLDEIKLLRKTRNLVQHGAADPAPEMDRLSIIAKRFFDKTLVDIFGLGPDELKISSLIKNEHVKKLLKESEEFIEQEEFLLSIVKARNAFEYAVFEKENETSFLDHTPISIEDYDSFFVKNLLEQIITKVRFNSFGINSTKYERYLTIVDHIPTEHRSDRSGHRVLQRDWNLNDAHFIYGFVSDSIYKWQEEKMEPLQELDFNTEIKWKEKINDIEIKDGQHGYGYINEDSVILKLFVDPDTKSQFMTLKKGENYQRESKRFDDGGLAFESTEIIELVNITNRLATHEPEIWEVIIHTKSKPFSLQSIRYENSEKVHETPNLNTSSLKEIKQIRGIGEKTASRIISYRDSVGKITGIEDLRKIKNITEEQIDTLTYSSTI